MKKKENSKSDNILATRLLKLRKENDLTQQQVADLLNLERTSVTKYESGQSSPSYNTLLMLSKIYNVSISYLLGEDSDSETFFDVASSSSEYTNNSTLPLLNTQYMDVLTDDEQFLVLYFRMLDRDPEILDYLRQRYNNSNKDS